MVEGLPGDHPAAQLASLAPSLLEEGKSCLKIGQQFSAVRKALDSTYLRMTLCFMEQELQACIKPDETQQAGLDLMLKDMETLLAHMGNALYEKSAASPRGYCVGSY